MGSEYIYTVLYPSGESAVGKSSLVLRFVKGQFHEYQESTIGGKPAAALCVSVSVGAGQSYIFIRTRLPCGGLSVFCWRQ